VNCTSSKIDTRILKNIDASFVRPNIKMKIGKDNDEAVSPSIKWNDKIAHYVETKEMHEN